jgi:hypothetical protein
MFDAAGRAREAGRGSAASREALLRILGTKASLVQDHEESFAARAVLGIYPWEGRKARSSCGLQAM